MSRKVDCDIITFITGPPTQVRASYRSKDSKVSAIKYWRGDAAKQYGTLDADYTDWIFDEANQLIGIYGREDDDSIQ